MTTKYQKIFRTWRNEKTYVQRFRKKMKLIWGEFDTINVTKDIFIHFDVTLEETTSKLYLFWSWIWNTTESICCYYILLLLCYRCSRDITCHRRQTSLSMNANMTIPANVDDALRRLLVIYSYNEPLVVQIIK